MLDLLLVNPNGKLTYGVLSELSAIEPPLWAALHAAYVREQGYSVAILDAEAEGLGAKETARAIADHDPLLVAIMVAGCNPSASSTPKMTAVGRTLMALKKIAPHIKTILGGLHPSALPEKTLKEEKPDFVAQGEGFISTWQVLCLLKFGEDFSRTQYRIPGLWHFNNEVISGPKGQLWPIDSLPMAAWDLLSMGKYRCHNWHSFTNSMERSHYAMVYTSLGCPFNCSYCPIHAMYGGKPGIRYRDPKKVADEIDYLVKNYGVRNIKFMDEMFALSKKRVVEICNCIAALGHDLNIWVYARADTVNMEMLVAMRQAGIRWLCFGFESCSELVCRGVGKKYGQERIAQVVKMCREAGIHITANFLFGLPDDTMETMQETLDMAKRFNFEWVNLYACCAYPGSQLYEDAVRQGVKLPKRWADYSQYAEGFLPLPTKYVSAEEVLRFRDRAFEEYFTRPEYLSMVKAKFGAQAREHIEEMLKIKVRRR